ncbi:glycoside hydrolase family 72 protein [Aplosporella prunicola CBS 121167]|uniref:1,3-beta-glucanosyltransferase n=1 Tax=Aplosporella prunicola CBS 121167 TaxID=1176127 RepID=A0A6A6B902_9PEZI|nr:glycoside hydrolase family 72 protein [Aplosporella prunicola CBS 121167]KAF2140659.1 glycoside hydrolase family 72 protein [Aplosporella prunicola CBS 121167]
MKGTIFAVAALSATGAVATPALAPRASSTSSSKTPQVSVKGNAFFAGDKRFYIRGVDYQPGGSSKVADPIADTEACARDVKEFQKLGINTVRVYTVDNSKNHDECMSKLADAGIYLALDVNSPNYSLNRKEPKSSYNDVYLQNVFATIDAFANYDNTLLFFSGNEVINSDDTTGAAPYVKAVTRDMKQYIGSQGYRSIPVGYSAADVDSNRFEMAEYMNCGTDDERSDFFAFNDYSWCDPSSYETAGWDKKVKQYGEYSIPLFLSEFGCNTNKRKFEEVEALYSDKMTGVYSGGLVYEYAEEGNNYGLAKLSSDSATENDDFTAYKNALEKTPAPSGDGGYKKDGKASTCPSKSKTWDVDSDSLPAIPEPAKEYMTKGAGERKGLKGGSQNAGTQSSGTATAGSGEVTATATGGSSSSTGGSSSGSAASGLRVPAFEIAPLVCTMVVLGSTLFGATLL